MIRCLYARFAGSVPAFFHFLSLDVIATAVLFQLPSLGMIAIPVFLFIFLEGNWERERELEKHRTSYRLKKRKWKNTAFSITPGKGNWKNTAFSITPGKGNWKNTAVASVAGMGTGKAQHVGGPSRHGQLKWVLSSTIMAISCDDLFFEKRQVSCQRKEMEEIKLLRDTWWVSSSTFVAL